MLLSGGREEMRTELHDLLKGYEQFLPFERSEIALIEPLRALRMIHFGLVGAPLGRPGLSTGLSLVCRNHVIGKITIGRSMISWRRSWARPRVVMAAYLVIIAG